MKIRLDARGIEAMLKSAEVARLVSEVAHGVADDVASSIDPKAEVVVDAYTTDRAAAAVTIRDVRGRIWQVRDGVLTRAAAAHGLEVTER